MSATPSEATDPQPQTAVHPLPPNRRRVVTGHDENGKAVLSMDDTLESKDTHQGIIRGAKVWTTDSIPTQDNNNGVDGQTRPIPGMGLVVPNGTNHAYTDLAPGATTPVHRTSSLDYNILLSGRLVLILDDDVRTEIKPGDVVVQRGTLHAWHNPSTTEWARWVGVLIDAAPAKVNGADLEEVWQP